MAKTGDIWFRIEDYVTASYDADGDDLGTSYPRARLRFYVVSRTTPKGLWLVEIQGSPWVTSVTDPEPLAEADVIKILTGRHSKPRFLRLGSERRFACSTKAEALESFEARKKKQCAIYAARIDHIHASIRLARAGKFGG